MSTAIANRRIEPNEFIGVLLLIDAGKWRACDQRGPLREFPPAGTPIASRLQPPRKKMPATMNPSKAPPFWLMGGELRAALELGSTAVLWPLLQLTPAGDGHGVMVLPGLATGDMSTLVMRQFLRSRGYDARGWGRGMNAGVRDNALEAVKSALRELQASSGRRVSLIGWSLGGTFARVLASEHPELVRCVVTVGTQYHGGPGRTRTWQLYEALSGHSARLLSRLQEELAPCPVPITSIYTRGDPMTAWRCCLLEPGTQAENIEVVSSHFGLGNHPAVMAVIADRLAQPEGEWRPFDPGASVLPGWAYAKPPPYAEPPH